MCQLLRRTAIAAFVCIAAFATAAQPVVADSDRASDESVAPRLMGYDFAAELDQQVYLDMPGASPEVDAAIGIKAASAVPQWPGDDKVLGLKHIIGGQRWTTQSTLLLISKYFAMHGELPDTGLDLFPELLTLDGYESFLAMTPTERIVRYHAGINPYAARFFESFTAPAWRPGGLFIDYLRVDDNGDILGKGGLPVNFVEDNEDTPAEVDSAFYYEVYSAKEGVTLFDDYCTFTYEMPVLE